MRRKSIRRANYSYVRALQVSPQDVEFSVISVREEQVSRRTLIRAAIDQLGDVTKSEPGVPLVVASDEKQSADLHDERTIPEIYNVCREQIVQAKAPYGVRLYFDSDGLLQHCGYLPEECDDCVSVAVQTIADFAPAPDTSVLEYFCHDQYGLYPYGSQLYSGCERCSCDVPSSRAWHIAVGRSLDSMPRDGRQSGAPAHWACSPLGQLPNESCSTLLIKPHCTGKPTPSAPFPPPGCRPRKR